MMSPTMTDVRQMLIRKVHEPLTQVSRKIQNSKKHIHIALLIEIQ